MPRDSRSFPPPSEWSAPRSRSPSATAATAPTLGFTAAASRSPNAPIGAAEDVMYPQKRGCPLKSECSISKSAAASSNRAGSAPRCGNERSASSASRISVGDSRSLLCAAEVNRESWRYDPPAHVRETEILHRSSPAGRSVLLSLRSSFMATLARMLFDHSAASAVRMRPRFASMPVLELTAFAPPRRAEFLAGRR